MAITPSNASKTGDRHLAPVSGHLPHTTGRPYALLPVLHYFGNGKPANDCRQLADSLGSVSMIGSATAWEPWQNRRPTDPRGSLFGIRRPSFFGTWTVAKLVGLARTRPGGVPQAATGSSSSTMDPPLLAFVVSTSVSSPWGAGSSSPCGRVSPMARRRLRETFSLDRTGPPSAARKRSPNLRGSQPAPKPPPAGPPMGGGSGTLPHPGEIATGDRDPDERHLPHPGADDTEPKRDDDTQPEVPKAKAKPKPRKRRRRSILIEPED